MATFQVSKKEKKPSKNVKKIVGISLLAVSSILFLFAVTRIWPWLQMVILGIFGVFAYPFFILLMVIGLALMNNKKYVMSKRYAVFLSLTIVFLLAIIQLIIVGNKFNSAGEGYNFWQYLVLNFTKKWTAGGFIIGFLNTCILLPLNLAGTYIILCLGLLVSGAFFVESFISFKKNAQQNAPVKIQLKEREIKGRPLPKLENSKSREEVNVVINGQMQENLSREQIARRKLGLAGQLAGENEYTVSPNAFSRKIEEEKRPTDPASLKKYLLTPPEVDMDAFMTRRPNRRLQGDEIGMQKNKIDQTFNQMKDNDPIRPSQMLFEQQFDMSGSQTIKRGNLPEIKPEQLVNEADNIIRSATMEELAEMGEILSGDAESENKNDFGFRGRADNTGDRLSRDRDFSRDNLNRDNLTRENLSRDRDPLSQSGLSRDGLSRDNNLSRDNRDNFSRESSSRDLSQKSATGERRFVDFNSQPAMIENKFKPFRYNKPSLELIRTVSDDLSLLNDEVPAKRIALENALETFGVPAKVQSVVIGPTVTRYEIAMPEGISVKKILSLDADIAYALSARGQIRIEAPIPGRSIVGIEVPNDRVAKVSIKDVLQSKEFTMSPSPLAFSLGKDISGTVRVCNLQKMPHLLVAGTTGSGKSVCLNSIIISMLYKASPDDVKFIMIDPKQVELSMYEGLPHMVVPKVITDASKAVNALGWAVDEMERRFNLISEARVRNIDEYNKIEEVAAGKRKKMPYLVIIFDEFADFMLVAKNEIEDKIMRLAQKARAAGIHLILATQRPSTDVVTGTIKANFPARIAFKVAGRVDSEVIMGATGAEKLLGYGDMLYKPSDSAPARIQGCFIDTPETKDVVNFIIQNNEETYDEVAYNAIYNPGKGTNNSSESDSNMDNLLPQALKICIDVGVASTTMVQRKLSIGYPRAARIIDQMEERGYISSAEGSKQRTVYTTIEEFYEIFGDNYD